MTSLIDDKERLGEFLKYWPPLFVQETNEFLQGNHSRVSFKLLERLTAYSEYDRSLLAPFLNSSLEKKREEFINAMEELSQFLELEAEPLNGSNAISTYSEDPKGGTTYKMKRSKFLNLWNIFHNSYLSFLELARTILSQSKAEEKGTRLIVRDPGTGNFYFNGKLIKCNDQDNLYFRLLIILYLHADGNGLCSYKLIEKHLEAMDESPCRDPKKIAERVNNAIKTLFRYTTLPKKTPDGHKIIEIKKGVGVIFFNPVMKSFSPKKRI